MFGEPTLAVLEKKLCSEDILPSAVASKAEYSSKHHSITYKSFELVETRDGLHGGQRVVVKRGSSLQEEVEYKIF